MKRRIIPAVSIVILFSLLFAIPALKQNSNENTYKDSLEASQEREVEIQKIIDAGVESFTPTFSEFYWPGCAFYKYTPSAFEAGFCDGTNLAHIPFHIGAGLYENRGIAALYLELVTSKEDGTEICKLSTEIKQWRYLPPPTYVRLNTTIDVVSPANKSKYIAGCELGIRKSFNIGLKEEESRVKRVKKIIENTPAPEKSNQSPQNPASEGVDERSNAYITMFSVGKNFAKVSLATDTAQSQCASAMNDGIIFARGIPRYLGVQTAMIQSLLKTKNGWQGCLDGFGQ